MAAAAAVLDAGVPRTFWYGTKTFGAWPGTTETL